MYSVTFKFQDQRGMTALLEKIVAHGAGPAITTLNELAERFRIMSGTMQGELDELRASVEELGTVRESVEALVTGIPSMIEAAVADAVAKGATPEQLAAFDEMNESLRTQVAGIVAAVSTNTPDEGEPTDTVPGGDDTAPGGVDTLPGAGDDTAPGGGDTVPGGPQIV